MAGSTIDHLIAMTILIGALLIFISLFNQTIQTAVLYQRNRAVATKCSDLIDNVLLNPGYPLNYSGNRPVEWGKLGCTPIIFGLQDPEFSQYRLSPFSLMRLQSSMGLPIYYSRTNGYYSNITMGFGSFLFVSFAEALNYSTVANLLGINNTYGFQFSLTPIVTVSINESCPGNPLTINVNVVGNGFPLSNATVSYLFIKVKSGGFPSYELYSDNSCTNNQGLCTLSFQDVSASESYAFIAYARFGGLVGAGHYQRIKADSHVIPIVERISDKQIILAHSRDIYNNTGSTSVDYNTTFVLFSQDFSFRQVSIEDSVGSVEQGEYALLTVPTFEPGTLVVTYQSDNKTGVALMPWGISSIGFPLVFGEDPSSKEWVATDVRQVIVGGVTYQAKLALWNLEGYGVMG